MALPADPPSTEPCGWPASRRAAVVALLGRLGLPPDASLLALGASAPGDLAVLNRPGRLVAIEADPSAREAAGRTTPSVKLVPSLETLSLEPAFDAALALDVLARIDDPTATLRLIAQWLLPRAPLLVTVPAHPWLRGPDDRLARRYTASLLQEHLDQGGFDVEWLSPLCTLGLAPAAALRLAPSPRGPPALPLSGRLGAVLDAAARVEGWWLARGRRLPLGLSLAAVARVR